MTKKKIFLIKFFVIKDFRFYFIFYVKTAAFPEKGHPPLLQLSPSKNWHPIKFPSFWKFGRRFIPPTSPSPYQKVGGGAHYDEVTQQ